MVFWIAVAPIIVLGYFELYILLSNHRASILHFCFLSVILNTLWRQNNCFLRRSYEFNFNFLISRMAMIATGKVLDTCLFYIIFKRFLIGKVQNFLILITVYTRFVIALSLSLFLCFIMIDVSIREYSNEINYE